MLPYYCPGAKFGQNADKFDEFVEYCAPADWKDFFQLSEVKAVIHTLSLSLKNKKIQPPMSETLKAFELVAPDDIKVVIIGKDPTKEPGEATGLAFSVNDPRKVGSAMNVLLEVALEGWTVDIFNGNLSKWANQGVLLLNAALTVLKKAGSHLNLWKPFTECLIKYISSTDKPKVWLLWGEEAKSFEIYIDKTKHYVITGRHPSPRTAINKEDPEKTFFGANYFGCANLFLENYGRGTINWGLGQSNFKLAPKSPLKPCPPILTMKKKMITVIKWLKGNKVSLN